jgi:hypothetical protein
MITPIHLLIMIGIVGGIAFAALIVAVYARWKANETYKAVARNNEKLVALGNVQTKTIDLMKKYDYYIMNHRQRRNYDREVKKQSKRKPNDNKQKPSGA